MTLVLGSTLGPYEIQGPLGAGGMGEVYEARDTRLDRTVAIKVLPEHLANDPDLKQRFEREARTVTALTAMPTPCRFGRNLPSACPFRHALPSGRFQIDKCVPSSEDRDPVIS